GPAGKRQRRPAIPARHRAPWVADIRSQTQLFLRQRAPRPTCQRNRHTTTGTRMTSSDPAFVNHALFATGPHRPAWSAFRSQRGPPIDYRRWHAPSAFRTYSGNVTECFAGISCPVGTERAYLQQPKNTCDDTYRKVTIMAFDVI